jgi:hypothetical protein
MPTVQRKNPDGIIGAVREGKRWIYCLVSEENLICLSGNGISVQEMRSKSKIISCIMKSCQCETKHTIIGKNSI